LHPVARVTNTMIGIAVPAALNVNTMAELVALARKDPGKLNWAGTTGALDFVFAGFLKGADVNMTKVPYRNSVDAANDLGENRVQAFATSLAIVRPQLQAGKIKVIAIMNHVRAPTMPDVPTVAQAGYPSLSLDGLVGLFAPTEMPKELRERIAADVAAAFKGDKAIEDRLTVTGQVLNLGGPAEFAKSIDEQRAKLAEHAEVLGVKPLQ
jgi:tripartite-type tricarboxylate transporter receptor subunit TctC